MVSGNTSWKSLFASPPPAPAPSTRLEVTVFKKAGEPLLVLPRGEPGLAAALDLYPAQSGSARLAKAFWRQAVRWQLPVGARDAVVVAAADPLLRFLIQMTGGAGAAPKALPRFVILAGNPWAPGRRFQILVFSGEGRPVVVVKAGTQPAANDLVQKEASFLAAVPPHLPGIPRLLDRFQNGPIRAFALAFVEGESPRPGQSASVELLLAAWLKAGRKLAVKEMAAWQRLATASTCDSLFARLTENLEQLVVQSTIFHGDLAPWNIKFSPATGQWTVLDWERGELAGPPGWDWFHFVLQPAALVQRQTTARLATTAQALLDSAPFRAYAQQAGMSGYERVWLLAYLLYCRDVLRPAEGSPRLVELLSLLAEKWIRH